MENSVLDGNLYIEMLKSGAAYLNENRTIVNDLNVFPVPDGDTGDNMFMTIDACSNVVGNLNDESLDLVAEKSAQAMLLGARGNSGVILSRIFAGIAKGFSGVKEANVAEFGKALQNGVVEAYKAVNVPVEGTILTVYKDAVNFANSKIDSTSTFETYFIDLIEELKLSLNRTPELLACLKEAGVVDSGGAGFVYIAEGMKKAILGEKVVSSVHNHGTNQAKFIDTSKFNENSELSYGYCTEFLLQLQNSKVDTKNFDVNIIKDFLETLGDSIVCFKEGTIVKVHVHTKTPGVVFNFAQKYGEFLTLKVENMTIQHESTIIENRVEFKKEKPHKKIGIVTVAMGDGIIDTFKQLGCDYVVNGGQSMNPSTEDFVNAFNEINADTILVFPNNSNVILTANQAAGLYDKAKIVVIPSKNIGQGYAAISTLNDKDEIDNVIAECNERIKQVRTGLISKANRDTVMNDVEIHSGDYIDYEDDTIFSDSKERKDVFFNLCDNLNAEDASLLLVVTGKDVEENEISELQGTLEDKYPLTEVIFIKGNQPIYDYVLIIE